VIAHIDLDNFSDENALDERSIEVGRRFALQVGALLAAQRQNTEREAAFEGALRAIGVALEARDLETFGHTDRVATLAIRVGEQLGLTPDQLRELRWGAYLHDMGKLMIPDTILLKPAKLTPEEFIVMKTHAYTGYQLSQNLPFLPESVRQVIHYHHERWDGNGYPAGLCGEEIPLMARIFSVCDVFDALTSSRPYKPAWAVKDALEEIAKQSGKQFDPQIVTACLEVVTALTQYPKLTTD
jgi:putative nucleotidyltransferase with HDIG domain